MRNRHIVNNCADILDCVYRHHRLSHQLPSWQACCSFYEKVYLGVFNTINGITFHFIRVRCTNCANCRSVPSFMLKDSGIL